jgi:hypothetical protein
LIVISVLKVAVLLNVFAPAKVWAAVVTTPPFVASAGVKVRAVPLIVAPFAFEVAEIAVIVFTPVGAEETQAVPLEVNMLPDVPGEVNPVPPYATPIVDPFQVPEVIVPTPVKLELVTEAFKIVPVKVPAFAIIFAVLATVTLPFSSIVNAGINVDEP